jgi:DNA-binding GntR family transcriptional regulator
MNETSSADAVAPKETRRDGRHVAKSQLAYEELRRRILDMELKPGEQLLEGELIVSLNVGRTPLREAMQRLATERMIVARSRQTPYVTPILASELAEIVEMRLLLEVPAARFAALRATKEERDQLVRANDTFLQAVLDSDISAISDSDSAIHQRIVAAAHNTYLQDCTQRMAAFSRRVWRLSSDSVKFDDDAFQQCHVDMIQSICAGDSEIAGAAAAEHVLMFKRRLSRLVTKVGGT